jgi:hypothetical protein
MRLVLTLMRMIGDMCRSMPHLPCWARLAMVCSTAAAFFRDDAYHISRAGAAQWGQVKF